MNRNIEEEKNRKAVIVAVLLACNMIMEAQWKPLQ